MEKKPTLRFTFTIVAIILGVTLYKQFDFKTLKFEHTGLAIIYAITFAFSIFYLVRNRKKAGNNP
ncbi:hypothetical protein [Paraflavitalea pollutisoli]|uniref:hypothetical protein n=1 Tax=Paraflavitalea pollutisoli TaxID=3034143 RepID=UPI0023EB6EEB|nr:hypothetical protein [Paraflavitalea sp. H1-2-19X]